MSRYLLFFAAALVGCAPYSGDSDTRMVMVIDAYEECGTLGDELRVLLEVFGNTASDEDKLSVGQRINAVVRKYNRAQVKFFALSATGERPLFVSQMDLSELELLARVRQEGGSTEGREK